MPEPEIAGSVRLVELGWDRDTAYYAFEADPVFAPLLWEDRVLTLSSSAGVRPNAEALAAAFLFALAPLGWTFGAEISTGSLAVPEPALACLERVGGHLRRHYGWPAFAPFRQVPTRPARWHYPKSHRALAWSGGVDSSFALLHREPEIDWLVHLSNFENLESRMTPEQRREELAVTERTAAERGLGWMHLRTNIAGIFRHNRFDPKFPPECSFWLGLEHLHHLATALAVIRPLLAGACISGGFSELHRRVGSCAADAAFVDLYDFPAPLQLVDELVPRQRKVEELVDRAPELLRSLRVCYSSGDGTCAACNKCQTTALMIVASGGRLADTSFPPAIVPRLLARIAAVREAPPEEHRSLNQALAGRCLSGSRGERWSQLTRLLEREAGPPDGV
jgi:hypothetical protein